MDKAGGRTCGYSSGATTPSAAVSSSPKIGNGPKPMPGHYDRPAERAHREGKTGHPNGS